MIDNTFQAKEDLINWINGLSDVKTLSLLNSLRLSLGNENWWSELNQKEKEEINSGIDDYNKNNIISSKEFWDRLKNA